MRTRRGSLLRRRRSGSRSVARRSGKVAAVSTRQRYRLRNPASGREVMIEAEPERDLPRPRVRRAARGRRQGAAARAVALAAAVGRREPALLPVVRPARPEGPQRLPHLRPAHGTAGREDARARLLAASRWRCSCWRSALSACGGSSVSDAVPKSTPEITPPTDTSAEKAAAQTTSTSTTSTKTTEHAPAKAPRASSSGEAANERKPSEAVLGQRERLRATAGASGGAAAADKEKPASERKRLAKQRRTRPAAAERRTGGASAARRGAASPALRASRSASRCRSGARSGTGSSTGPRCRSCVWVVCVLVLVHPALGPAGPPGGVVAEAERERRRPRGHRQRDDVALLDRDRGFERELGGLAEVGLQFDERALRDELVGEVRLASGARGSRCPASATPPSLALKNLIWVAFGLPSVIVQATIVPLRGALSGLLARADLDLEAGRAADGQARGCRGSWGRWPGVVAPITPTSVSVAGATAGSDERERARSRATAMDMRLICAIQHARTPDVAV